MLESTKIEKFEVRLFRIALLARIIGIHRLQTLQFYSFSFQICAAFLAAKAERCHENSSVCSPDGGGEVPPRTAAPILLRGVSFLFTEENRRKDAVDRDLWEIGARDTVPPSLQGSPDALGEGSVPVRGNLRIRRLEGSISTRVDWLAKNAFTALQNKERPVGMKRRRWNEEKRGGGRSMERRGERERNMVMI
ncbi:hypothetical protein PRIPAC_76373 [Pristionchus pacificus]|uniref:Uncharacterized protein n=1 Tax=Pristionchus pacificus TaxID=54126 RepID=A0A2A6CAD1_PRIPA|nr:hypothetical protein PRIPAC_76373 [Pristionchus pacificus]|eukprot:PDM75056.1 hypothetical protein PRIPAC_40437 [Pristionchus pacificus]